MDHNGRPKNSLSAIVKILLQLLLGGIVTKGLQYLGSLQMVSMIDISQSRVEAPLTKETRHEENDRSRSIDER